MRIGRNRRARCVESERNRPTAPDLSQLNGADRARHRCVGVRSAFNETGPGRAGVVYAGNGVSATTAGSPNAVSQYDVACYQVSQSH